MKTRNDIANELYGVDFDLLSSGEKATVTRAYNGQPRGRTPAVAIVSATIGRVGVNGTKTCQLHAGATLGDLLSQAGFSLDEKKEKVIALSTGTNVGKNDPIVNGEEYSIAVEVKSA